MSRHLQAVFFDVDGVLIDSLPHHLQICHDKAKEFAKDKKFKLDRTIPSEDEFRRMVSGGETVSPMQSFFQVVGFPEEYLDRAVDDYEREFMDRYHPEPFPGVEDMLRAVRGEGRILGIATSNTRENVIPALGESMKLFEESCLFFYR